MTEHAEPTWTPPGPGSWVCDRSHTSTGPTRLYRRMVSTYTEPTYRASMERFGGAVGSIDMQFVHGAMYRRIVPLIAPDRDNGKVPPNTVLWLATRLHPEFRRREKQAAHTLANNTFVDDIRSWTETERYEWIDRNRELQSIDFGALDDQELARHLRTLSRLLVEGWVRHHELHASDIGPIGDLLAHAAAWELDPSEVMSLLRGSSPATTSAAEHGTAIARALRSGGVDPASVNSLDDIRAVAAASDALDAYLDLFGWRLISDYDIEGLTLNELPNAVVAMVRAAADEERGASDSVGSVDADMAALESALRATVDDPQLFDELLRFARLAYGVRDDNGPLTWAWPAGLTRRAYLEAADRLVARGRMREASHVFELDIDELAAVVEGAAAPDADELAERAAHRAWEQTLHAPDGLGPPLAEPDLAPLPPAIRRVMGIIMAAVTNLDPDVAGHDRANLSGLGVGATTYRGVARVVEDAAAAVRAVRPGEVLVTAWTAPSFNAVLGIAGGVVVQEGGLLCHAAVMARELAIPAVVGCADAMTEIRDGDLVEIDPTKGQVTVLESGGI